MSSPIILGLGTCGMVGIIAGAYYAMLMFHDPDKPKWLENRWADEVVVIFLISLGTLDFGLVLKGLVTSGVDPLVALIIVIAFVLGTAAILWRKLHMRERLHAARTGLSPFGELRHIRYRQRHRLDGHGTGSGAIGAA